MSCKWAKFREEEHTLADVSNPFNEIPNTPHQISTGQWLWFVPEQENHGMREEELKNVLDRVFCWAKDNGHTSVVTNGIPDIDHCTDTAANRRSDDQRTRFLIRYSECQEKLNSFRITLTSLNDAFTRMRHGIS